MLLGWTMRSTGRCLEFLAVPVLLISLISGKLLTFQVLPVTWHADTGTFRDDILHVFRGPLWCWIVLAASVNISFSVIGITIIVVILSYRYRHILYIFSLCFCYMSVVCCITVRIKFHIYTLRYFWLVYLSRIRYSSLVKLLTAAFGPYRAALISESVAFRQAPTKAAGPWTRGQCIAPCACLPPAIYQSQFQRPNQNKRQSDKTGKRGIQCTHSLR